MAVATVVAQGERRTRFDRERLQARVAGLVARFPHLETARYWERLVRSVQAKEEISAREITDLLITNALDEISIEQPDWTHVAALAYLDRQYKEVAVRREAGAYGDYFSVVQELVAKGFYDPSLLEAYTEEELTEAGCAIVPERDELFTYIGIITLSDRYLARDYEKQVFELPQERFMTIALFLLQGEDKARRLSYVKEAYWALSKLYMTVATPTLANAGKTHGQLSSCFIDIVGDSLRAIYDSNTDVALLSKGGGGIGVYLGKIRSLGSDIKGFKGVSSGIVPWARQLNNTAVSVDQLGSRQGSIAIYLDVWHRDIFPFLDLKLNNGDERLRTHDLFSGVCIPDLFMEQVEQRGDWYLFDPHEVRSKKGWSLEDYYDEQQGGGSFRTRYQELIEDPSIHKEKVQAIEVMKRLMRSQLETGVPYMFYRDTVNRDNPNKHKGMIYCSNLCTEIAQNLSPTKLLEERIEGEDIILRKRSGDFVTCNLSSVNLPRSVRDKVLGRLIPIQVRLLDAVIDRNTVEVKQARITNQRYRAIGLGTFGLQHLLALEGIHWESEEAVRYNDALYEEIAYLTIQASAALAEEKGAYPYFQGSDWDTGAYFHRRYGKDLSPRWKALHERLQEHGLRNGYLMAVAPNVSTSVIAGSTATIDPIYQLQYTEEKKNYRVTVTAPDISPRTLPFYRPAHAVDQRWTIRQNAARQRHIDQSQSCNLYVKNTIRAKELLELHNEAWHLGIKTTYYIRSTSVEVSECALCSH